MFIKAKNLLEKRWGARGGGIGREDQNSTTLSVVLKDILQSVAGRTELSGFDPYVQVWFVRLSQEAVDHVRMSSTNLARPSRWLEYSKEINSILFREVDGVERALKDTAAKEALLVGSYGCKVYRENSE